MVRRTHAILKKFKLANNFVLHLGYRIRPTLPGGFHMVLKIWLPGHFTIIIDKLATPGEGTPRTKWIGVLDEPSRVENKNLAYLLGFRSNWHRTF